jgi:hypothetical protein
MHNRSGGMRGLRAAADFADAACRSSMGAVVKARIMEAYLRLPI